MLKVMALCHLQENVEINMSKKKKWILQQKQIDAAKTTSKRVVQKTAEVIGDLIGNKIVNNINSVGKTKNKK